MLRSELVESINKKFSYLNGRESEQLVNLIFLEICHALTEGKRIELRGFGTFSVKNRMPRIARNPRTGDRIEVGSKLIPYFRAGKGLNNLINS